MGDIIPFGGGDRHARASSGCKAAKVSNVIPEQPLPAASRTKSGHRRAGMPRLRQELTVDAGSPNSAQSAAVPPSASITAAAVNVMDATLIRGMRTCQGFAGCETTENAESSPLAAMARTKKAPSSRKDPYPYAQDGQRLAATRDALGYTQEAFAKEIGVKKNVYNPYETGKREISKKAAKAIRKRFGLSLDWIFCADATRLPNELYAKLIQYAV